jgi:hypothetical protein
MPWVYDPHSGGVKISPKIHEVICKQVESFARARPWYPKIQLKARFKSQLCYIGTIEEGDDRLFPLCRLRHFTLDSWSLALFTYSNEKYQPCVFQDGTQTGTIEEALRICEPFII